MNRDTQAVTFSRIAGNLRFLFAAIYLLSIGYMKMGTPYRKQYRRYQYQMKRRALALLLSVAFLAGMSACATAPGRADADKPAADAGGPPMVYPVKWIK